jgi:hypothetical protein
MARFHQGDLAGAEVALQAAERKTPDRAELHLYQGLLLLQRAEAKQAAAALERARETAPGQVEPIASYYAGLAWASADERGRAEEALRRVGKEAPGSVWEEEADRALRRLEESGPGVWWVSLKSGMEYDDNVVLAANGVSLPREISSAHDVRAVWELNAGMEFYRTADWQAGGMISYSGSAHQDLNEFNVQYPAASLWLDRRLSEVDTAHLQYDAGYAWFDGDPYFFGQALTPTLYHDWGDRGVTSLFTRVVRLNFLFSNDDVPDGRGVPFAPCLSASDIVCGPAGINESSARNRDGWGLDSGFEHRWALGVADTQMRAGYTFEYYSARGSEYSFTGHELHVGTRTGLPYGFVLDALVSYTYRPYRNRSTFPDPDDLVFNREYPLQNAVRRDHLWYYEVALERRFNEYLSGSVEYRYFDYDSNVDVFDYDREILGAYLTIRFHQ